ncbi:LpxI family protein [Rhizobium sp. TRM95796]|uniref:LpxI family protein n=1 Tax=Rhizobium sp. TRM95796 TaxID=2979862 RepID=UPI0021E97AE8|nr:UDP-2,3-diacylglucosamine diphosphatase LpxI [Rhizobium sp. TRM95796]MCV3764117.1 UDP-2,3-diacylglucosamine diphosphatase LpxI [Rhizobium sp. TRM95796]
MVGAGDKGRLAIIAGSGKLPQYVADAASVAGEKPFIFALQGEADGDWSAYDHVAIGLGDIARFKRMAEELGVDRIIMSGGVSRRPPIREVRLGWAGLAKIPGVIRKLTGGGDNTVLTAVIEFLEAPGRRVIGAHEVAPDLLAQTGSLGAIAPDDAARKDIAAAVRAARLIGALDIGQGAIAVGGRVVALEGPEGTDAMVARVRDLKAAGRVSAKRKGVLVKLCKPGQDMRVDLPSAGLRTVTAAAEAGLAGIALEAGRSLLLDAPEARALADQLGVFVFGLEPEIGEGGA